MDATIKGSNGETIIFTVSHLEQASGYFPAGFTLDVSVKCSGFSGICSCDFYASEWLPLVDLFVKFVSARHGSCKLVGNRGSGSFSFDFAANRAGNVSVEGELNSTRDTLNFWFELDSEFLQRSVEELTSIRVI
jgi:hypothetical protein